MGNQQASTSTNASKLPVAFKDWQWINEVIDSRYGKINVYQNNSTGEAMCLINRVLNEINLPKQKPSQQIDHPNILRLYYYEVHNQTQYCSKYQQVTLIYEYLTNDLARNIQVRNKKNFPYSMKQLWGLLKQTIESLIFLKQSNVFHRDLIPSNILLSSKGVPKLWNVSLLNKQFPGYNQVALNIREELHLSPEELIAVREKQTSPKLDFEKCDIFQLGLTLLEASSFEPSNSLYDGNLYQIDFGQLEQRIQEVEGKYGVEWASILRMMLSENANNRGSFEQYLTLISSEYDTDIIAFTEDGKKLGNQNQQNTLSADKQSENIWFSTSKNTNEVAQLAIEDLFNNSQNQNADQFKDPPQQLQQQPVLNGKQQQPNSQPSEKSSQRRNSRHSLQSKEINLNNNRPPSVMTSFRQQQYSEQPSLRKKSIMSEYKMDNYQMSPLIAPSKENNFIAQQQEELRKQQQEFDQLRRQFSNQEVLRPKASINNYSPSVTQHYKENNQRQTNSLLKNQSQQKVNTSTEYFTQQSQPVVGPASINTRNSPIGDNLMPYYSGQRNVNIDPQLANAYYAQPKINNNNLDQKIEEVLLKSKQALARFNQSIQGMPLNYERKPLNNFQKNDQNLKNPEISSTNYQAPVQNQQNLKNPIQSDQKQKQFNTEQLSTAPKQQRFLLIVFLLQQNYG